MSQRSWASQQPPFAAVIDLVYNSFIRDNSALLIELVHLTVTWASWCFQPVFMPLEYPQVTCLKLHPTFLILDGVSQGRLLFKNLYNWHRIWQCPIRTHPGYNGRAGARDPPLWQTVTISLLVPERYWSTEKGARILGGGGARLTLKWLFTKW